jgi:hypothetical protein
MSACLIVTYVRREMFVLVHYFEQERNDFFGLRFPDFPWWTAVSFATDLVVNERLIVRHHGVTFSVNWWLCYF